MPEEPTPELKVNERANAMYGEPLGAEPGEMPEPTDESQQAEEEPQGDEPVPGSEDLDTEGGAERHPSDDKEQEQDDDKEVDDEQPAVAAEGDTEEVEVQTLDQLAEHLETDNDWLMGLKSKAKIRGEEVEFTIGEAVEAMQKVKSADSYLEEAKKKGAEHAESLKQREEELGNSVAEFTSMIEVLEGGLTSRMDSDDMKQLRKDDPAEWAARNEEFKEQAKAIDNLKQQARHKYQSAIQTINKERDDARKEALPKEQEALLSRVPEWKDTEKAEKEVQEVLEYLRKDGFSDEHIKTASWNGRLMALATKAHRYDQMKSKSQAAKKKVTKIPKVLKPGSQKPSKSNATTGKKTDRVEILYGQANATSSAR